MVKEEITDDEGGDHKLPHNTLVNKITEEVVDEDGTVHDNSAEGIVGFLSATLWAFLLRVTKTSRYVPYDILVE